MIDFVDSVATESALFQQAIEKLTAQLNQSPDGAASEDPPVAACPEWTVPDLIWHLAEVQYFWASIVEGNLANPEVVEPLERPADGELVALMAAESAHLNTQLEARNPGEPCWSWHPSGGRVAWVRRRQAHEALIHRVDAELALQKVGAGNVSDIDEELATDGVDEMLAMMLNYTSSGEQAEFVPDGTTIRIEVPGRTWWAELGVVGASGAGDGNRAEAGQPVMRLIEPSEGSEPTASVSGPASELDLWLWRRADLQTASVTGDRAVVERLHQLANLE